MSNPERIKLEDLQELAESFANLNMVDLKMADPEPKVEVPPQGEPPVDAPPHEGTSSSRSWGPPNFEHAFGSSSRKRRPRPKTQESPVGKAILEPIHPYGLILNLDGALFKDWEALIDEWSSSMKVAITAIEYSKEEFIRIWGKRGRDQS